MRTYIILGGSRGPTPLGIYSLLEQIECESDTLAIEYAQTKFGRKPWLQVIDKETLHIVWEKPYGPSANTI